MKSILLIRHAKSSWPDAGMKDFDRPLSERGRLNAAMMAERLAARGIIINAMVTSTAKRALDTCRFFADVFQTKEKNILKVQDLYHASPDQFNQVISWLDEHFQCVAVFSHNPGITQFINEQTVQQIDHMPTCGVFGMRADIDQWSAFPEGVKTFWFFDYPKHEE